MEAYPWYQGNPRPRSARADARADARVDARVTRK